MSCRRSARRRVSNRSCSARDPGWYGLGLVGSSVVGGVGHGPIITLGERGARGPAPRPADRYHPRPMSAIERVGVVGCGLMGSGIAEVCARAGLDVVVREVDAGAAEAGLARLTTSLDRGVRSGKLTEDDRDAALGRVRVHHRPRRARRPPARRRGGGRGRGGEGRGVPRARQGRRPTRRRSCASNTSSIPIMKLGIATQRPEQVIGIHFFNPVPVLRLVELVTSLLTSPETIAARRRASPPSVLAQAGDPQPGPRRLRRQRAADPVPPVGDPDDGVGLRHRRGHRHRHGRGLQPPDGPAAPGRPHRARHHAWPSPRACTRSSRSRCTRRRRCCRGWSRPGCSAARPAAGFYDYSSLSRSAMA